MSVGVSAEIAEVACDALVWADAYRAVLDEIGRPAEAVLTDDQRRALVEEAAGLFGTHQELVRLIEAALGIVPQPGPHDLRAALAALAAEVAALRAAIEGGAR